MRRGSGSGSRVNPAAPGHQAHPAHPTCPPLGLSITQNLPPPPCSTASALKGGDQEAGSSVWPFISAQYPSTRQPQDGCFSTQPLHQYQSKTREETWGNVGRKLSEPTFPARFLENRWFRCFFFHSVVRHKEKGEDKGFDYALFHQQNTSTVLLPLPDISNAFRNKATPSNVLSSNSCSWWTFHSYSSSCPRFSHLFQTLVTA